MSKLVYSAYCGNRKAAVLCVAVELGLFGVVDALHREGQATAERLRSALELSPRGADALFLALQCMGLLTFNEKSAQYALSEDARRYLLPSAEEYFGSLVALEMNEFITPAGLLQAVRTGQPQVYHARRDDGTNGAFDMWEVHARDAEQCARFTWAMQSISIGPARALAQVLWPDDARSTSATSSPARLLDVGGGSGCYAVEWIRRAPLHSEAVLLEMPSVCAVAREMIQQTLTQADAAHLSPQITARPGDMFAATAYADAYTAPYTHVLLSQILHDWPVQPVPHLPPSHCGAQLVRHAYRALRPGGTLIVHEKLVHDADTAMVTVDMLYWTEGQQYTREMLQRLLTEAGFTALQFVKTPHTYWWACLAHKPGA
ncbi:hypothetical protein CDCA_CDCA06G1835 [Cyanidium caldarium]|uniref:O-methyltransferase n=1 Tax=Cyanidium caldarium TaxID=2771 RepID=A0AAV9IUM4_CYACA|nr:hypothetical protein CDCA_CDCA06G1835 [Cyanidium caldarium]